MSERKIDDRELEEISGAGDNAHPESPGGPSGDNSGKGEKPGVGDGGSGFTGMDTTGGDPGGFGDPSQS